MSNDSKPKGWFSRRYQQDHAHRQATVRYQGNHERFNTEPARVSVNEMTADQVHTQWEALDARLGRAKGATKERARLAHRLKELVL